MLKTMKIIANALVFGAIVMGVVSCRDGDESTVRVDGHVFRVPKAYLVKGEIPWLPISPSDFMNVIINPNSDIEEQMIVTIESTSITCRPSSRPISNQLATVCSEAHDNVSLAKGGFQIARVARDGDPSQWQYIRKDRNVVVASCYSLSEGDAGICTSMGRYKDLVYSVRLRDVDIVRLPMIRQRIENLLQSWDRA